MRQRADMAAGGADKFSVLLPTYNERENLPLVVWLLARTFRERYRPGRGSLPPPGEGREPAAPPRGEAAARAAGGRWCAGRGRKCPLGRGCGW